MLRDRALDKRIITKESFIGITATSRYTKVKNIGTYSVYDGYFAHKVQIKYDSFKCRNKTGSTLPTFLCGNIMLINRKGKKFIKAL